MKNMVKVLIVCIIILILIIVGVLAWFMYQGKENENNYSVSEAQISCTELGCSADALYVGSINSDKYYPCDCHYAQQILSKNIICFTSDDDAKSQGYIRSEC